MIEKGNADRFELPTSGDLTSALPTKLELHISIYISIAI